ncbi:MAG TPA: class I SAM-dependent methyltransferase [Candidatus Polarisedimenticolaceae bacterium]|nr:class I SAM-dependent methyltransferase [Candidatus Polarisedimenticolaceae bacterium]
MREAEDPRIAQLREVFDGWARDGRAEGMEHGHGVAARRAFELLELPRDGWYLDVGCGNGYTVRWAAEAAPDGWAVGIDLSPAMVDRARAASREFPNVELQVASFPDTTLPHGCFDAVLSMEVVYYLPDMDAALREIARLLVPGGRFACVVDYYEENVASHRWPDEVGVEMTLLDAAGWRRAMERVGLQVALQERVTQPAVAGLADWKVAEGSLLTLAQRPAE